MAAFASNPRDRLTLAPHPPTPCTRTAHTVESDASHASQIPDFIVENYITDEEKHGLNDIAEKAEKREFKQRARTSTAMTEEDLHHITMLWQTETLVDQAKGARARHANGFAEGDVVEILLEVLLALGDLVEIKQGTQKGGHGRVIDPSWKGQVKVEMTSGADTGQTKSYAANEVKAGAVQTPGLATASYASNEAEAGAEAGAAGGAGAEAESNSRSRRLSSMLDLDEVMLPAAAVTDIRPFLRGTVKPYDVTAYMTLDPLASRWFDFKAAERVVNGTHHFFFLSTTDMVSCDDIVNVMHDIYNRAQISGHLHRVTAAKRRASDSSETHLMAASLSG